MEPYRRSNMPKSVLFLVVAAFLLLGVRGPTGEEDFRMVAEKIDKDVTYRADDFYSVYYIYMNVVRALKVDEQLGARDIEQLISLSIDSLKQNKAVQVQIDRFHGPKTLRVTLRPDLTPTGDNPILFLLSNYHMKSGKVVSDDDMKDAYATYFYLKGDKLVKYQYVHEPKTKKELKKMSANNAADYYLLDADPGNDERGMQLLLDAVKSEAAWDEKAVSYMTLSEYYLLQKNAGKAKECLDQARAAAKKVKDGKRQASLKGLQGYADDIYRYYVNYTEH